MAGDRISTTLTHTVELGAAGYGSVLTITGKGAVRPAAYGASGILSVEAGAQLFNHGTVSGGAGRTLVVGGTTGDGGDGIDMAGGLVSNSGTVEGGGGGVSFTVGKAANGGTGGAGIDFSASATLLNHGVITAGAGGIGYGTGGNGGIGVDFAAGGVLSNGGMIAGGYGLDGSDNAPAGSGGAGVYFGAAGTLVNSGTILGGGTEGVSAGGGGQTGAGVVLAAGSLLSNAGSIEGGSAAADSGARYIPASNGGAGVLASYSTLTNSGTIEGGHGGNPHYGYGGTGGIGVSLDGGSLRNTGQIIGGIGGYTQYYGGTGGTGVYVGAGAKVVNAADGAITGGLGGNIKDGAVSGNGGVGVYLGAGGLLTNLGTIYGGAAALSAGEYGSGGNGGAGVYLNGGTLVNAGTIGGGAYGYGIAGYGVAGYAVQFGALAGTLVLDPGAAFVGQVAAYAGAGDVLMLTGVGGTLSGLGTEFTGFSTIADAAHADWTLAGSNTLAAGSYLVLRDQATLTVRGTLGGGGAIRLEAGATVAADAGLGLAALRFTGSGETLMLGSTDAVSATISGFGKGDVIDLSSIVTSLTYLHHTLTLLDGSSKVLALVLAGDDTAADFTLKSDHHGGTDIDYTGAASAEVFAHGHGG